MALPRRYQRHWRRASLLALLFALSAFFVRWLGAPILSLRPSGNNSQDHEIEELDLSAEEDISKYRPGGYHPVLIGDVFNDGRYIVQRKIGQGEYATVWLSKDVREDRHVALKILTANCSSGVHELDEIELLRNATTSDPAHPGYRHVVTLLDHFSHEGVHGTHICLVFDMLGPDIYKLMSYYDWKTPLEIVRTVMRQVLLGLDYLHTRCGIIHTDVKQDNVLIEIANAHEVISRDLVEQRPVSLLPQKSRTPPFAEFTMYKSQPLPFFAPLPYDLSVKVVDLGVSNWVHEHFQSVIQPPALRAPEVILGAPWSVEVDIWNAGCMLYYLLMGDELFHPSARPEAPWSKEEEHLAQMIERLGLISPWLVENGKYSVDMLNDDGTLSRIEDVRYSPGSLRRALVEVHGEAMADEITDVLERMLEYDPKERDTARQLVQHPFFKADF